MTVRSKKRDVERNNCAAKIENDTVGLECIIGLALVVGPDERNIGRGIASRRNHAYEGIVISISSLKDDFRLIARL